MRLVVDIISKFGTPVLWNLLVQQDAQVISVCIHNGSPGFASLHNPCCPTYPGVSERVLANIVRVILTMDSTLVVYLNQKISNSCIVYLYCILRFRHYSMGSVDFLFKIDYRTCFVRLHLPVWRIQYVRTQLFSDNLAFLNVTQKQLIDTVYPCLSGMWLCKQFNYQAWDLRLQWNTSVTKVETLQQFTRRHNT